MYKNIYGLYVTDLGDAEERFLHLEVCDLPLFRAHQTEYINTKRPLGTHL